MDNVKRLDMSIYNTCLVVGIDQYILDGGVLFIHGNTKPFKLHFKLNDDGSISPSHFSEPKISDEIVINKELSDNFDVIKIDVNSRVKKEKFYEVEFSSRITGAKSTPCYMVAVSEQEVLQFCTKHHIKCTSIKEVVN